MNNNTNKIKLLLALILLCLSSLHVYAEMPLSPNLEELSEQSKVVVCGEPIKEDSWTHRIGLFNKAKYMSITFKVHKVYKGSDKMNEIKVLVPVERSMGCSIIPTYKEGKKYLLFLKSRLFSKLYIRVKIDDIFGERKWDKDKEQEVIKELNFLADPDKWKKPADNLNYTIPKDANEKIVDLTKYQQKHKFSKRAKYWLDGELVGERAWYGNGQIAYAQAIKNGMQHGIYKAWYSDGRPRALMPYRKNRVHGILKHWDNKGNLKTSYWIRGKPVTLKKYRKASKTNMTLPKIKRANTQTNFSILHCNFTFHRTPTHQ